jgi:hypothetical protein
LCGVGRGECLPFVAKNALKKEYSFKNILFHGGKKTQRNKKMILLFSKSQKILTLIAYKRKGWLKFSTFIFEYCQIWLNIYITEDMITTWTTSKFWEKGKKNPKKNPTLSVCLFSRLLEFLFFMKRVYFNRSQQCLPGLLETPNFSQFLCDRNDLCPFSIVALRRETRDWERERERLKARSERVFDPVAIGNAL